MPIKIGDKVYPLLNEAGQRNLTAREQMLIEREFKKPIEKLLGSASVSEKALKSMTEEQRDALEVEKRVAFYVMIWIARLRAGENLSFNEATDVEFEQISAASEEAPKQADDVFPEAAQSEAALKNESE